VIEIQLSALPHHLVEHPIAKLIEMYRATSDFAVLDQAGQALVPIDKKHWYLVTSKS
jgi:hypothetical protein